MRSSGGVRGAARAPTTGVAREARTTAPGAAARGAGLTPAAVLQLQRTVGNREVGRLLQRVKSEEERAAKQRRVAGAAVEIPRLAAKMKPALRKHLFDAKPFDADVDPADPQGLHAYTGGRLPGFVVTQGAGLGVEGSTTRVHKLTWRHRDGAKTKMSTMFPDWMSASHVAALCALRYPTDSKVVSEDVELTELAVPKSALETHILHGQEITLAKSGDTVYPTL